MSKLITVYVPISRYVKTTKGEDHIINPFEVAISRETYDMLCDNNAKDIETRIKPIVDDLKNLIKALETNNFTCEFDQNSVTIYHPYCPTLDRDHVTGSGKDYKGLSSKQKVEVLKRQYIESINEQIQNRLQQAHDIIADFEYHPIQIDLDELEKMTHDTSYSETGLAESDDTDPMDSVPADELDFDDPVDQMDRA